MDGTRLEPRFIALVLINVARLAGVIAVVGLIVVFVAEIEDGLAEAILAATGTVAVYGLIILLLAVPGLIAHLLVLSRIKHRWSVSRGTVRALSVALSPIVLVLAFVGIEPGDRPVQDAVLLWLGVGLPYGLLAKLRLKNRGPS